MRRVTQPTRKVPFLITCSLACQAVEACSTTTILGRPGRCVSPLATPSRLWNGEKLPLLSRPWADGNRRDGLDVGGEPGGQLSLKPKLLKAASGFADSRPILPTRHTERFPGTPSPATRVAAAAAAVERNSDHCRASWRTSSQRFGSVSRRGSPWLPSLVHSSRPELTSERIEGRATFPEFASRSCLGLSIRCPWRVC